MTLEQLRIFVAVAERQHMTRAARALGIAQSAASDAVAALERGHRVRLFRREGRGLALTAAGRVLLGEAQAVLDRVARAERTIAREAGLAHGTLALMASQTVANYWLPRHLARLHRAHPGLGIALSIGNTRQVADAVREGAVELGFTEGERDEPSLLAIRVAVDRLVLVVGPEHPWAGRDAVPPEALRETPWVLREPGSGTRSALEASLARLGVAPNSLTVALELPSNEAVRAAVEAGAGAAAISASVAAPSLEAELLALVGFDLPDRAFYALRRRGQAVSRPAEALLALVGA